MDSNTEFTPDVRYAYATGRIRVLESKLLSSSKVDKMIQSPTIKDALIYLEDTAYDDTIAEMKDPNNYEDLVIKEKQAAFTLMERLIPDAPVKHLFRIPYDFHNIKLLLKKRSSSVDTPIILSDLGTVAAQKVKDAFETENFNPLPEFMRKVIGEALAHYYLKKSLKSMEFLVDNFEYDFLLSLAGTTGIPFLINYIRSRIDLTNVSTFLRIRYFDTDDNFEEALIKGGTLPPLFFMKLAGESVETIPTFFRNTPYARLIDTGVKKITEDGTFSIFDRESENFILQLMRQTRFITFGVEPITAYFVAREQDLNIIKMIIVGKLNELPDAEIRERIPMTLN